MSFAYPTDMGAIKDAVGAAAGKKVVFQFSADFCTVCKGIKEDLDKLAADNADKVQFVYIDINELEDFAEMYEVADLPTFVAIDPSAPTAVLKKYSGSKMDQITAMIAEL